MFFSKDIFYLITRFMSFNDLYKFSKCSKQLFEYFCDDSNSNLIWTRQLLLEFPLNDHRLNKMSPKKRFVQLWTAYNKSVKSVKNYYCHGRYHTAVKRRIDRACVLFIDICGNNAWNYGIDHTYTYICNKYCSDCDDVNKYYQKYQDEFIITLKRGDCLQIKCEFGYKNDGLLFFDGEKVISSGDMFDDYGNIPEEFTWPEFPPCYWNGIIEHNTAFPIHKQELVVHLNNDKNNPHYDACRIYFTSNDNNDKKLYMQCSCDDLQDIRRRFENNNRYDDITCINFDGCKSVNDHPKWKIW